MCVCGKPTFPGICCTILFWPGPGTALPPAIILVSRYMFPKLCLFANRRNKGSTSSNLVELTRQPLLFICRATCKLWDASLLYRRFETVQVLYQTVRVEVNDVLTRHDGFFFLNESVITDGNVRCVVSTLPALCLLV